MTRCEGVPQVDGRIVPPRLLAYAVATGLPGGLLIYVPGEGVSAVHAVARLPKRLEVATLDLAGSSDGILVQVRNMAAHIRLLHQTAITG